MKRIILSIILLTLLLTACTGRAALAPAATEAPAASPELVAAATPEPTPYAPPAVTGAMAAGPLRVNGSASVLTLDLPTGWTWEAVDGDHAGVALWPEIAEDFRVTVTYWPDTFAVCGTGVTEREVHVGDDIPAVLMTEEAGGTMTWTLLLKTDDSYVLSCIAGGARFETYSGGLNELLASLKVQAR